MKMRQKEGSSCHIFTFLLLTLVLRKPRALAKGGLFFPSCLVFPPIPVICMLGFGLFFGLLGLLNLCLLFACLPIRLVHSAFASGPSPAE